MNKQCKGVSFKFLVNLFQKWKRRMVGPESLGSIDLFGYAFALLNQF